MKKTILFTGCLLLLFFTACQKELSDNTITLYPGNPLNDTAWLKSTPPTASVNELLNSFLPEIIVDSFDVSKSDTTLTYGDSLSISFTAGSYISTPVGGGAGTLATGKARLEIVRLKKKGDYIKAFKATTSNGYLLEAGGGFFIRVLKDGKELSLAPGATVKIRFSDIDETKVNMQAFYGKESNPIPSNTVIDTAFTWIRDTDTTWLKTFQKPAATGNAIVKGYELTAKNLRWIAAERYIDSTQAKTKITAILSPNYTNKNTAVFAVFLNQKTIVTLAPDYPSRSYAANNIPISSKIRLISISKIGDGFYLGIKDINDVGRVTSYTIVPEKKSLADILTYLNTL